METVFITGIGSDIGKFLAQRYMEEGYKVCGTHRTPLPKAFLNKLEDCGGKSFYCDCSKKQSVTALIERLVDENVRWSIFISSVGTMNPIGKFLDLDFDEWEHSIYVNALSQLKIIHGIYSLCEKMPMVAFFAGGGTNNAFPNYSAYCTSKIFLMKMTELLDDEIPEANVLIAGPGMIGTKIHKETLQNKEHAGVNYKKTVAFLDNGTNQDPYRLEQIFRFLSWARKQGKDVCGGRNFSIVHDEWEHSENLIYELQQDRNMYKLRRNKNDFGVKE